MSVNDAAGELSVSPRRVRQLVEQGALPAQRVGRSLLLQASAVRARAAESPSPGRPFSPDMAWALLRCLDGAASGEAVVLDRRLRHRVGKLSSEPHTASDWRRLLAARGRRRRFWVHPGAVDGLLRDARVHEGRARAAAAHGMAISAAGDLSVYVAEQDLVGLIGSVQAESDEEGNLLVYVVPQGASAVLPAPGDPVGAAAAAADMLESGDARMQHVGGQWLLAHGRQLQRLV